MKKTYDLGHNLYFTENILDPFQLIFSIVLIVHIYLDVIFKNFRMFTKKAINNNKLNRPPIEAKNIIRLIHF